MFDLQPGDEIWINVVKADGSPHRRWIACVEEAHDGSLALLYSDNCSPVILRDGAVLVIDHELDVAYWTGQTAKIVDQDEFAEAIIKYGCSAELQGQCRQAADDALAMVRGWQPAGLTDSFTRCP